MKADIHPTYYPNAKITCACGKSWKGGTTRESIEVGICSACHPFYTGKEKILDTQGRVDKFKKRMEKAASMTRAPKKPRTKKSADK
jgi:large subunit ribosomal protein L31